MYNIIGLFNQEICELYIYHTWHCIFHQLTLVYRYWITIFLLTKLYLLCQATSQKACSRAQLGQLRFVKPCPHSIDSVWVDMICPGWPMLTDIIVIITPFDDPLEGQQCQHVSLYGFSPPNHVWVLLQYYVDSSMQFSDMHSIKIHYEKSQFSCANYILCFISLNTVLW